MPGRPEFVRRHAIAFVAVALIVFLQGFAVAEAPRWVSDQLLVRSHSFAQGAARAALAREGASTGRALARLGVEVVHVPRGQRAAVQRRLRASGLFRFVERNYVAAAAEVPNDPLFPSQWALGLLDAPSVWDVTRGGGVIMAVVDSGVDSTHPDLSSQLVEGYNTIDGSADSSDDNGHGTRMAGIAGARGFDGFGVIGLAPESQLMPIKSLDGAGQGTYADVAEGIVQAVDRGARVISLSLGGPMPSTTLSSAVAYAMSHGVVVVAAGGNSGIGAPSYPAGYSDVIAVGASDAGDERATFSNYGAWLDVIAPGVEVLTTGMGGGFSASSGTSPATPFVAAAAALLASVNPSLQPAQIASILATTSEDLGAPGFDDLYGWGRLNAVRAVEHAAALATAPDSGAPSVEILSPADGATLQGSVSLLANADDDVGVARVEYLVDGIVVAASAAPPFVASWESAPAVPGPHLFSARAYDALGNSAAASAVTATVSGNQAGCDTPSWTCLAGGGPARTDCYLEWLVRAEAAVVGSVRKGRAVCTDGASCDADGVADGVCTFPVALCFASEDARLVTRSGELACDVDDLESFHLVAPGFRRSGTDVADRTNARSIVTAVAALSTGEMTGRCAAGLEERACTDDASCNSAVDLHDGVCGLEHASLAGVGGVEACSAVQSITVPLRYTGTRWRKGTRVLKGTTSALSETMRNRRDGDVLKLECLPPS